MDLRELQKSYLDNLRKVTEDKLEIGSLVRTVISILVPFWNILPLMDTSPEVILSKVE